MLPLKKLQGCWTKGCDQFNLSRLKQGVLLQSYGKRNSWKDAARAGLASHGWESSRDLKQGSSGLVFPDVLWAIPPSLLFPGEGIPKFCGCTGGSLLLARIPCSNGGCLRYESLLSAAAARRVLFRCFYGSLPWTLFTGVGFVFGKSALLFPQPRAATVQGRIRSQR